MTANNSADKLFGDEGLQQRYGGRRLQPPVNPRGGQFTQLDLVGSGRPLAWLFDTQRPFKTVDDLAFRYTARAVEHPAHAAAVDDEDDEDGEYAFSLRADSDPYFMKTALQENKLLTRLQTMYTDFQGKDQLADQLILCSDRRLMLDLAPDLGRNGPAHVWELVRDFFYPRKPAVEQSDYGMREVSVSGNLRRFAAGYSIQGAAVALFSTGNSYHLWTTILLDSFTKVVAGVLAAQNVHALVDLPWLANSLQRGYAALRISPKLLPQGEVWPTLVRADVLTTRGFASERLSDASVAYPTHEAKAAYVYKYPAAKAMLNILPEL